MTQEVREQVRRNMMSKSSDELISLLEANDRSEYTETALEVAREVLIARKREAPVPRSSPPIPAVDPPIREVRVRDIDMPFGSMVVFMVKWAIAAIPAIIILTVLAALVAVLFGGLLGGLFTGMQR